MGAVNRCGNIRLSRIPRLMSMAARLAALLLAASPVRAQTLVKEHQQRLLDASREFVEMSKELSADGTISDQEVQQIRPLIIKLREIINALPCGGSYDYFDLAGRQTLHKGPAPECRLITTKSGGLPWDVVPSLVPSDDQSTATVTGPAVEPVAFRRQGFSYGVPDREARPPSTRDSYPLWELTHSAGSKLREKHRFKARIPFVKTVGVTHAHIQWDRQ